MSDFTGLAKAKKEDLESAINSWNCKYNTVKAKYDELLERSKSEYLQLKFLWIFPYKKNTYEYIKEQTSWDGRWWTKAEALCSLYAEEFSFNDANIYNNYGHMDDIEAMYELNPDEVYLSSEQAAKVGRWK